MSTTTDLSVANEIARQIGGAAFFMMGAQNKTGDDNSLSFKIRGSRKVTHIKVELTPADTYTVTFLRVRAGKIHTVATVEGVYNDMLKQVIESNTGLYLSL